MAATQVSLYVRADCDALTDAKLLAVGPDGFTVYFKGLMYAKQHLTDGFVPVTALPILAIGVQDIKATVAIMVSVGLWHEVDGGYTVTPEKWAKHQTTKEQVETNREKVKKRVADYRARNVGVTPLHDRCNAPCNDDVTLPKPEPKTEPEPKRERESQEAPPPPPILDPWWDGDYGDGLVRDSVLAYLEVPKFSKLFPSQAKFEKLIADQRARSPDDEAIRYELEGFTSWHQANKPKYTDGVGALRSWFGNKHDRWADMKRKANPKANGARRETVEETIARLAG